MTLFKDFELEVVKVLTSEVLSQDLRARLIAEAQLVGLTYTGAGYFLTVQHSELPLGRTVCNGPLIIGEADGIECGFIIFLENRELTLECHGWGNSIPDVYRELDVSISYSQPE